MRLQPRCRVREIRSKAGLPISQSQSKEWQIAKPLVMRFSERGIRNTYSEGVVEYNNNSCKCDGFRRRAFLLDLASVGAPFVARYPSVVFQGTASPRKRNAPLAVWRVCADCCVDERRIETRSPRGLCDEQLIIVRCRGATSERDSRRVSSRESFEEECCTHC
jgi:hypothetical protein